MLVGEASILIVADTRAFERELRDQTAPAFDGVRKDAEAAGADAGAGMRRGVKDGAAGLEGDLAAAGAAGGVNLREGVAEGSKGLEHDLADIGAAGGLNLRRGVGEETGKLADDVAKDGERAGEGLHKGISGGLSKLATLISSTGLPLGALSGGLEKAGEAAGHADSKAGGLAGTLDKVGGVALAGVAAAGIVIGGFGVHIAEGMQTSEAAIAGATGQSVASAQKIGAAFDGTAFKSEQSGNQMAAAYAGVAGQLKATEGRALSSSQALEVMTASSELAEAKQIDLGTATSSTASIMQAFGLKAADAGHVTDVLYSASNATGQSIDALSAQLVKVRGKLGDTAGSVGDLAGLLVDMTDRGITGRAAMAGLNSGMNTLQKTGTGVQVAVANEKAAYDQMSPSLQKLADAYRSGSMTSADFTKATDLLPPAQSALAKSFAAANTAVQTAQQKLKDAGVTAFDTSGKFVGMGSIIDQLHPKFAHLTEAEKLAAASTIFGAGAARQMTAVIDAGPAAYDKATASVNRMGAAHDAAAKQASTLHGEEHTLEAGMSDLAGTIGAVLIPILTAVVGAFVSATKFVTEHKLVLIALATVITGVLGTAIAVFTVNKMAAFGRSFREASDHVGSFATSVKGAVEKVIGLFSSQSAAADATGAQLQAAGAQGEVMGAELSAGAAEGGGALDALGAQADGAGAQLDLLATQAGVVGGEIGGLGAEAVVAGGGLDALGVSADAAGGALT